MRFDYIPPFTYYRVFNIRRYYTMFWASSGLLCILFAIFASKPLGIPTIADVQTTTLVSPQYDEQIIQEAKGDNSVNDKKELLKDENSNNKEILPLKPKKDVWKTIAVNQGDSLSKIFDDLALSKYTLHEILTNNPEGWQLSNLAPGQKIKFLMTEDNELKSLKIPLSKTKTILIKNTKNGYQYTCYNKKIIKKFAYRSNKINGSLFLSGQAVGLADITIMQLAEIFGCDIDFALDIRKNDRFKIVYEEDYIGKKRVKTGNILMAEFTNQNKTFKAIRFTDPDGHTGYYSPEGYNMQKAFLRSPVKFTRISSRFSTGRRHPLLHKIRAHRGVDYAAPHGTPVKASGDGKVVSISNQNGYGKTIELKHGTKYSTLYAHLSSFSSKLKPGSYVKQGQVIGFVGKTGLASGNHLHYEFRINGIHHDPLLVTMPKALPISNKFKVKFLSHAKQMVGLLSELEVNHLSNNG